MNSDLFKIIINKCNLEAARMENVHVIKTNTQLIIIDKDFHYFLSIRRLKAYVIIVQKVLQMFLLTGRERPVRSVLLSHGALKRVEASAATC